MAQDDKRDVTLDGLAEALAAQVHDVPDTLPVLQLANVDPAVVQDRIRGVADRVGEMIGASKSSELASTPIRIVVGETGAFRVVGFHASGAFTVKVVREPFDGLFERDPGDEALAEAAGKVFDRLGLRSFVVDGDELALEKIWRIKAAAGDRQGILSEPVLCRAVAAYRQTVVGTPVIGRAAMTVEIAGDDSLVGASMSSRRVRGDGGGERLAQVKIVPPLAAAESTASTVGKLFGDRAPRDVPMLAERFELGYLSLGRRRRQTALAPFYVSQVSIDHGRDGEATAHVFAVPASEEQWVRLPQGRRPSSVTVRSLSEDS